MYLLTNFNSTFSDKRRRSMIHAINLRGDTITLYGVSRDGGKRRGGRVGGRDCRFCGINVNNATASFSFHALYSSGVLQARSSTSIVTGLTEFLGMLLPRRGRVSFSPVLCFARCSYRCCVCRLEHVLV